MNVLILIGEGKGESAVSQANKLKIIRDMIIVAFSATAAFQKYHFGTICLCNIVTGGNTFAIGIVIHYEYLCALVYLPTF